MKTLLTIAGTPIVLNDDGSVTFLAPMMIDDDGSGPDHGDPDEQPDTSLHRLGAALNADLEPYIVLPPQVILAVAPTVLGCRAHVLNTQNGLMTDAVVGDVGPRSKIGEASIACARAVGVPWSPTTGGVEGRIIRYTVWPGVPAVVGGRTYLLQPYRS